MATHIKELAEMCYTINSPQADFVIFHYKSFFFSIIYKSSIIKVTCPYIYILTKLHSHITDLLAWLGFYNTKND